MKNKETYGKIVSKDSFFCGNCMNQVPETSTFCIHCQSKLDDSSQSFPKIDGRKHKLDQEWPPEGTGSGSDFNSHDDNLADPDSVQLGSDSVWGDEVEDEDSGLDFSFNADLVCGDEEEDVRLAHPPKKPKRRRNVGVFNSHQTNEFGQVLPWVMTRIGLPGAILVLVMIGCMFCK